MDSPKVRLGPSGIAGGGVFAVETIFPSEMVASFDGPFYDRNFDGWNADLLNHAIQCAADRFRDSAGIARYVNHSCEANCGIKGLFDIVAMRTIQPGEEITWDYEMTEDSDWWRMDCRCGSPRCRKVIGAYRNLPEEFRVKYRGFISQWLVDPRREQPAPDPNPKGQPQELAAALS
jgi:hypothetical protein